MQLPPARAPPLADPFPTLTRGDAEMDPHMDERQRRARGLDALEAIAEELWNLRVLKEHELGVTLEFDADTGGPYVAEGEK
jgi:hypothetical protein